MDRTKWTGLIVAGWLLLAAGVAAAQTPAVPTTPPALSAQLETCQTSPLPAQRVASFVGSMPAIAGVVQMQMRFELQRRKIGERDWRELRGVAGFGVWETSDPSVAGFVFHKRVDGLQVPASYRALVRFRYNRADGTLVRRDRARTRACYQPDLRPDLLAGAVRARLDARPALAIYTVTVRNAGYAGAGPFAVRVAGGVSEVAGLAAGTQVDVMVVAPACTAGSIVEAIVDADHRTDESSERNALRLMCPLGS